MTSYTVRHVCLAAAVILLTSGCQRPLVASISDEPPKPLEEGFCIEYKRGLLYGDFWHNAPREIIWARSSAIVRPQRESNGIEVEAVSGCSSQEVLPVHYTHDTSTVSGGPNGNEVWEMADDGTGQEVMVLAPGGVSLKYSLAGNRLGVLHSPLVAPRSRVILFPSSSIDEHVFIFIDTRRDVAYRVALPIRKAMSLDVGEKFSLDGTQIKLDRLN